MFQRNWKSDDGMKLFAGDEGPRRIALMVGLIYALTLVVSWKDALKPEPLFVMRAICTAGWWMAFCGKRPAGAMSGTRNRLVKIGVLLVLVGSVLQLGDVLYRL
jgi:hypothetical protein